MEYELSKEEIEHIERYRDLLPEFQAALDSQMKILNDLQTSVVKAIIKAK